MSNSAQARKPYLAVLATGGTIAGRAASAVRPSDYAPGVLAIDQLLDSVPELAEFARIEGEQIANIGSEDMTEDIWLKLAAAANARLARPGIDGLVVIHGTDTMEETAYFLNLTVRAAKPLVITGAMRPANAPGADGPANLLNAVRLAASREAGGKGVLVCMNDGIGSARGTTKTSTSDLAAFRSPVTGDLGVMMDGKPMFYREPVRRHTADSEFGIDGVDALPRVEIVYGHAGQKRDLVDAAVAAGARGIVHAGVGMGMVHKNAKPALEEAAGRGVIVVCSSRTGSGLVPEGSKAPFVTADNLNPQKARVLLQLALTRTSDPAVVQKMFNTY